MATEASPIVEDLSPTTREKKSSTAPLHSPEAETHSVPSKRRVNWLSYTVWIAFVLAAAYGGYWLANSQSHAEQRISLAPHAAGTADIKAVPVTVEPVTFRQIERSIEAVGNLHGYDELTMKSKINGRIARIYHEFGDKVAAGELLLEFDTVDAQLAVEQARRALNSELARWGFSSVPEPNADLTQLPTVVASRLKSELARSQLSRLTALQNRGSVSADELEQAKTTALVADSDYSNQLLMARAGAATAQLKKAELDIAEQTLAETRVIVPLRDNASSGGSAPKRYTITDRYVSEGAYLMANADLFRLVIDDTLKLRLTIPEKHAPVVRVGQRVEVSTLTATSQVIGTVTRISPAVDPQTRTFQIEAEVPNEKGQLKTGGFAKARVIVDSAAQAQTVPVAALVTFAGVHKVFVVEGDKVKEVPVQLGEQTASWIEIVAPQLTDGTVVVTSGQRQLADASTIRIRQADAETKQMDSSNDATQAQTKVQTQRNNPAQSDRGAQDRVGGAE